MQKKIRITDVLYPHWKTLTLAFLAVLGTSITDVLEPWPLKIVLDNVLHSKKSNGWLNGFIHNVAGYDTFAILKFACIAVIGIAILDAISSYAEK